MVKKNAASKTAAKAAKRTKAANKMEKKEKKQSRLRDDGVEDEDLEGILERVCPAAVTKKR
jgi:hypothetical protein